MADEKTISIVIRATNLSAAELEKARLSVAGFKKDTEGASGGTLGLGNALRGASSLAGVFGVALGAAGLVRFGKELLDDADAVVKLADKTGLSTDAVQELDYIAGQSGNTLEQLTSAVSMLQKRIGAGEDSAIAAVQGLGLSIQAFQQLTPDEQFLAIAREVAKIEDPVKRATVATEVFGRSGTEILPSLIAKVDELRAAAPKMSVEAVQAFDAVGDGLARMWTQTKNVIGEGIAKALSTGMDLVAAFKSAWSAVPGPLKDAGAAAVIAAAGVWALNAASGALVKTQLAGWAVSAAGGLKTLGSMTMAFGWQGFAVTLGGWVAPLTKIGAALTAIPGGLATVGAALGAVVAAAGVSAALGEKGYDGLRKGIENLIGPSKAWREAQQQHTAATMQQVDAEARFMDAASQRVAAEKAHASLLDLLKTKQSDLAAELSRFTNEGLQDAVKAIRTNETAFNAWAEAQGLSKEAVAFLTAEARKQEEQHKKTTAAMKEQSDVALKVGRDLTALGLTTRAVAMEDMTALQRQIDAAATLGAKPLEQALILLRPELEALARRAETSGLKVDGLQAALDRARAASAGAAEAFTAWELSLPAASLGDLIGATNTQNEVLDTQATKVRLTTDAYHAFGLKTPEELRAVAAAAEVNYQRIVAAVGASAPAAVAAYKQMIEAQIAVTGELPKAWSQSVFPGISQTLGQLQTALSGTFAQMMLGAKGFKEGFVDIWASIKASIVRIFAEIADAFLTGLLKRMLAALAGQKNAFAGGFAGLFSLAGGGGTAGTAGKLGGLGPLGSLFGAGGGTLPGASGIAGYATLPGAAGTGSMTLAGSGGFWAGTAGTALGAGGAAAAGAIPGYFAGAKWGKPAGVAVGGGTGAATGALIGSVVPGLGTAIGALIGGLSGAIGGLFGGGKQYKDTKKARGSFEAEFGGSEAMIAAVSAAYATLGRSGKEAEAALKNLWQAKDLKTYDAAVQVIITALTQAKKKTDELAAAQQERESVGAEIAGVEAELAALQGQQADRAKMNWQQASEVAAKYGVTLEALGQPFVAAKQHDAFASMWDDWQTLTDMGADAGGVLVGMKDELIAMLVESQKLGTEIPANFKPLYEELARTGQLVVEDTSGFKEMAATMKGLAPELPTTLQPMIDSYLKTGKLVDEASGKQLSFAEVIKTFGKDAPENVKDYLQKLGDMDQKLAENKGKTVDLSTVKFGAPLVTESDKVTSAIGNLIAKLAELVAKMAALPGTSGAAAAEVADQWRTPPWQDWPPPTFPEGDGEGVVGTTEWRAGDVTGHAAGALITREHVARVGEGNVPELIGPVGFMASVLAQAMAALGLRESLTAARAESDVSAPAAAGVTQAEVPRVPATWTSVSPAREGRPEASPSAGAPRWAWPQEPTEDSARVNGVPFAGPRHAAGAVVTAPELAMIGDGGEPEIVGPAGFMAQALTTALAGLRPSPPARAPSIPEIVFRPQIIVDGRQVAEAMAPYLPAVLKQYGLVRT